VSLINLSIDLAGAGRRDEGLAVILEAVEVCRRLAVTNPTAYEPDPAKLLSNLPDSLAAGGCESPRSEFSGRLEALAETTELEPRPLSSDPPYES